VEKHAANWESKVDLQMVLSKTKVGASPETIGYDSQGNPLLSAGVEGGVRRRPIWPPPGYNIIIEIDSDDMGMPFSVSPCSSVVASPMTSVDGTTPVSSQLMEREKSAKI
jgi:hypothetical protein